jgi:hypothetical protein
VKSDESRDYCHAEQSAASRIFMALRRRDSSPSAQNDILTQSAARDDKSWPFAYRDTV